MKAKTIAAGSRFSRLTVIERAGSYQYRGGSDALWRCNCDCGNAIITKGKYLRSGHSRSCGCHRREILLDVARSGIGRLKHEATCRNKEWPEYEVWRGMKARCFNPRNPSYPTHGGRGITVCDRWHLGPNEGFECFIADMGRRPAPHFWLRRIDTNGGDFEPDNCIWSPTIRGRPKLRGRRGRPRKSIIEREADAAAARIAGE